MAASVEDCAAVDNPQSGVLAQAEAFRQRSKVPAVDQLAIDGSLAPVRLERGANAIEKSRLQRVARGGQDPQPSGHMSCAS
jgi:hypothetical protein